MPVAMQAKLLRVLEEGEIERIGADKPTKVDVRVVVATHRNLEQLVESGGFRRDLYHRVVVFPLTLPPLRARCEDLPALVEHFARQVSTQNGWKPVPFSADAIAGLKQYAWPGNIRELRNIVERLLLLADGEVNGEDVRLALPETRDGASGAVRPQLEGRGRWRSVYWLMSGTPYLRNSNVTAGILPKPPRLLGWSEAIFTRNARNWVSLCRICRNGSNLKPQGLTNSFPFQQPSVRRHLR